MNSILDFLPALKQKTAHEYAGPCPTCGGEDRFTVWPDRPRGGAYLCRGCNPQGGDGIQFMREFMGMSYPEACAALGLEPKHTTKSLFPARRTHARIRPSQPSQTAPVTHKPAPPVLPCKEWMASAAAFLTDCQRDLDDSPAAVEALTARYLTPDTARASGLGWHDRDEYLPRTAWGLPVIEKSDGSKRDKLLVPRGLVIATRRRAGVVALTVRCTDDRPAGRPKYWQVASGGNVPFVAGSAGVPLVLMESALDAALVWQESFNTVAAVAFMGSTKPADADTNAFIRQAPLLLACPDRDEAGAAAWGRWSAAYPQAILTPAGQGKDLGEMHTAALSWPIDENIPTVGEWLTAALSIARETAHTGHESHENTQHEPQVMPGTKEAV